MSEGGELIRFPKAPDDAVKGDLEINDPRRRYGRDECKHPKPLTLDVEAHALVCGKCGQVLDSFDFLFKLTAEWERFNAGYRAARQQERAAVARVKTLERLERNAKARIRKHGVTLTTAQARVVRDQLRGLQYVAIHALGHEEAVRQARLNGVDSARLHEALDVLNGQLDLTEKPDTLPDDPRGEGATAA